MRKWLAVFGTVAIGLGGGVQAAQAACKIAVYARLPVTMEGVRASVPVEINGKPTKLWLDSGAFFSIMPKARAVELGLKTQALPFGFYITGIGGSASVELATIKSFKIVGQDLKNIEFLVGGQRCGQRPDRAKPPCDRRYRIRSRQRQGEPVQDHRLPGYQPRLLGR